MSRYGGHRVPDYYSKDWKEKGSLGEWWEWWHLGYEDGYDAAEWEFGVPRSEEERVDYIHLLEQERKQNDQMKSLIAANYRVMKEEIRKELEDNKNISA